MENEICKKIQTATEETDIVESKVYGYPFDKRSWSIESFLAVVADMLVKAPDTFDFLSENTARLVSEAFHNDTIPGRNYHSRIRALRLPESGNYQYLYDFKFVLHGEHYYHFDRVKFTLHISRTKKTWYMGISCYDEEENEHYMRWYEQPGCVHKCFFDDWLKYYNDEYAKEHPKPKPDDDSPEARLKKCMRENYELTDQCNRYWHKIRILYSVGVILIIGIIVLSLTHIF